MPRFHPPEQGVALVTPTARAQGHGSEDLEHLRFDVEGMHCAACAGRVEKALAAVPGVVSARVNIATHQASVEAARGQVTEDALAAAVAAAGYSARPIHQADDLAQTLAQREAREAAAWRSRFLVGLVLLLPLVWLTHRSPLDPLLLAWVQLLLATPLQFYVGWPYLRGACRQLGRGAANMDTLVALGTGVAYTAGVVQLAAMVRAAAFGATDLLAAHGAMYFADAGMILTFITLGKLLETKARGRVSDAIRGLLDLAPPEATVVDGGEYRRLPVREVAVGQLILVRPGEKVPLDAEVTSGSSTVDQSWLTGESMPVEKTTGQVILAGTINGSGALTARVLKPAGQTALAQVVELVRRAQESKGHVGRLADRVVAWFVPVVLLVALAAAATWAIAAGDHVLAISSAVAVLVVACPCALGLATPTAVLVGTARGAQMGILIKHAEALETAGRLTTVVLDKTGTVTVGRPQVVAVAPAAGVSAEELLRWAAAAERMSEHPLAAAIVAEAQARRLPPEPVSDFQLVPGGGVRAETASGTLLIGNERLMHAAWVDLDPQREAVRQMRRQGQTPLWVALDGRRLGVIALADPVAPASRYAVQALKSMGLSVQLVSGDNELAVRAVAAEVGVEELCAEVLPHGKQERIAQLRASGHVVAMVGDGINDAPALAAADLGIAIGSGADVAIQAADIVLVGSDLRGVVKAIALSRATLRTIRQNLAWAFFYNILLIPVAAGLLVPFVGFHLPPAAAAAAMAASSVSVVTNSLLLRYRSLDPHRADSAGRQQSPG